MRKRYTALLLALVILGVFYPTIFGELCSLDDQRLVTNLTNERSFHVTNLFFRHNIYYYRPLSGLSFKVDKALFLCQPQIMHMENILIHLVNTLLLFFLICGIFRKQKIGNSGFLFYVPLLGATFFGIHPLTTEPVNWISGRTDLLAGLFCLASFALFILPEKNSGWWTNIAAGFFFFLGLLSKEVAISVLPLVILATGWKDLPTYLDRKGERIKRAAPFLFFTVLYLWLRTGFHFAHDSGIKSAINGAHSAARISYLAKLGSLVKALGFYTKKIIWPFPLNFAIVSINRPLCFAIGIMACAGIAYLLWKRKGLVSFFLLWPALFIAPALLVAANKMAWTPLAERYLYLPLMGLSMAASLYLAKYPRKAVISSFALVLLIFGFITANRNIVWQQNLTLFADVVKKSPDFPPAHNEYATALLYQGRVEEAKKEYEIARELSGKGGAKALAAANLGGLNTSTSPDIILANILENANSKKVKRRLLRKLSRDLNRRILECKDEMGRRILLTQNIRVLEELRKVDRDPFLLYRLGQLHLATGNKKKAEEFFGLACKKSNDFYTGPACKLCKKLSEELEKCEGK